MHGKHNKTDFRTSSYIVPYIGINKNTLSYLALEAEEAAEVDLTDEEIDECGGDIFFGF